MKILNVVLKLLKLKEKNNCKISKIENNEAFNKLMLDTYQLLSEIITIIEETNPELALKLCLLSASQVNTIQSDRNNFEESCNSFINAAMKIYQEGKYNQNIKYQHTFSSQIYI